ncbi:hypothetical protein D3C80_1053500 [compost metagenome]
MAPACLGKSRLTMPGSNTPITPMLAPAMMLPANRPNVPIELRKAIPAASITRMPNTTRSLPKRRASIGASGANSPRHSTGKVVSKPACAALRPRLCDTSLSKGAMLDSAGRRFNATRTRPSNNSQGRLSSTGCCCTCSSSASQSISSSSSSEVALVRVAGVAISGMVISSIRVHRSRSGTAPWPFPGRAARRPRACPRAGRRPTAVEVCG